MPKLGTTIWDAALARRLYDEGATYKDIGEQVGTAPSLISQFASRHWPPRDQAMAYQPGRRKLDRNRPRRSPAGRSTLPPLPSLRGLDCDCEATEVDDEQATDSATLDVETRTATTGRG